MDVDIREGRLLEKNGKKSVSFRSQKVFVFYTQRNKQARFPFTIGREWKKVRLKCGIKSEKK